MSESREPSVLHGGSIEGVDLDFEHCYRAVRSRDQRFDGWFFTAVTSTGIYCRPSCPALTPRPENVRFYPSAAGAQRAGFRACRRCRPDAAPGSPEWDIRADTIAQAVRLIADGVVDRDGVSGLAARLGYTARHLHRMLVAELGAGPLALARAQRAHTARLLIETTELGLAEIAFAAGFGSIRQFNDTVARVYAAAPSQLRQGAPRRLPSHANDDAGTGGTGRRGAYSNGHVPARSRPRALGRRPAAPETAPPPAGAITLRLAYRPPLHAAALLDFLAVRAVPGVEQVDGGTYRRVLRLPHGEAAIALTPGAGQVSASLRLADLRDLAPAVARCRRLLDLDADPEAVDAALGADPALSALVAREPGVRVPRAADGFEMAVRAIVGQQVSVAGARTVLGRLAAAVGGTESGVAAERAVFDTSDGDTTRTAPVGAEQNDRAAVAGGLRAFPDAEQVLRLPDGAFAMPTARRETIRTLARAVVDGRLDLEPGADRAETARRLTALPGIGAWTAGYIALRALGDPDAFLPTDLGVRRGAAALGLPDRPAALAGHALRWRPWRSYAVVRLWR